MDHEPLALSGSSPDNSPLIRPIAKNELASFLLVLESAFGISSEEARSLTDRLIGVAPLVRTRGAFAGSDLVGTLGCYPFDLTVPGGTLPMAGTALVSVLPTHRKQGVMRALMQSHLDDARALDEPLAGLWTADGSLYGRYGYGPATDANFLQLDSRVVRFRSGYTKSPVRLLAHEEVENTLPAVYDRVRIHRPGMLKRTGPWWQFGLFAYISDEGNRGAVCRFAVHESGGSADGYVAYTQKRKETELSEGIVQIVEMMATTQASHEALWRYVTQIEMHPNVEYARQPVDDELRWLLVDPRSAPSRIRDALWLRILDVERALGGRAYDVIGTLRVCVTDPLYRENSGTYLVEADGDGATCRRVDADAEITMDIDVLASLYLGGRDVGSLVRAGRIRCAAEAARKADRFFRWDRAPWCPEAF